RMELNAVDRERAMSHGHHLVLETRRRDLELIWDGDCRERVVAAGLEFRGQAGEDAATVVAHRARLPVDEPLGRTDLAAEGLDDSLMSQADAECRHVRRQPPDDLDARSSVTRPPGPGRDN